MAQLTEERLQQLVTDWFHKQKGPDGLHQGRTLDQWMVEARQRVQERQAVAGPAGAEKPKPAGVGLQAGAEISFELPDVPLGPDWQLSGKFKVTLAAELKGAASRATTRAWTVSAKDGRVTVDPSTKRAFKFAIGELLGHPATLKIENDVKDSGGSKWSVSVEIAGDGIEVSVGAQTDPAKFLKFGGSIVTKEPLSLPIPGLPTIEAGAKLGFDLTLGLTTAGQVRYAALLVSSGIAVAAGGLSLAALVAGLYMIGEAGRQGTEIALVGGNFGEGYANSVAQAYQSALNRESQAWREGDSSATLAEALRFRTGVAHDLAKQAGNMAAAADLKPLADDPQVLIAAIRGQWAISATTSAQELGRLIQDDVLNRVRSGLSPVAR